MLCHRLRRLPRSSTPCTRLAPRPSVSARAAAAGRRRVRAGAGKGQHGEIGQSSQRDMQRGDCSVLQQRRAAASPASELRRAAVHAAAKEQVQQQPGCGVQQPQHLQGISGAGDAMGAGWQHGRHGGRMRQHGLGSATWRWVRATSPFSQQPSFPRPVRPSAGLGGAPVPKTDLHRFVKWPKYVRLQRQKRVLSMRLKVPPALNMFATKSMDKNQVKGWTARASWVYVLVLHPCA
jgi:hypothetical protein